MMESNDDVTRPVFRAAKRRKVWRRRTDDEETPALLSDLAEESTSTQAGLPSNNGPQNAEHSYPHDEEQGPAHSPATALRRPPKSTQVRKGGIAFANNIITNAPEVEPSKMIQNNALSAVDQAQGRFVPQMGMMTQETIENSERHMASYVDSKLAELHGGAESSKLAQSRAVGNLPKHIHSSMYGHGPKPATESEALQEVDLGPEAVLQNIARTEAARRKLAVGESLDSDSEAPKRVRLGRDGKPRRNRNRRSSADMKRDQMVERLMRDTQLGVFQEQEATEEPSDGKATDDRVAEQFWQEYMEQVNYRNMRKGASNAPGTSAKAPKGEVGQKGPKLGGSRSARAAMKAQEEKVAKK